MNYTRQDWSAFRPEKFEYNGRWLVNWFSNLTPIKILIDGIVYNSVENYYQAMKLLPTLVTTDHLLRFASMTPSKAKQEGKKLHKRPDWETVKLDIMYKALKVKFNNPIQKEKLLATGNSMIIEWNNWGDRIWGADIRDNRGINFLGQLLMQIRDELKQQP